MPPDLEKNTLRKRAKRYADVSKAAVGAGARVIGGRALSRGQPNVPQEAIILRAALGGLKGPLMKVAQMLASIPDLLPPAYAQELATLQADAPPMSAAFVHRRMGAELGAGWADKFKSFEMTPAAAASLGQIHRAVSHDGRALACKLQYPNMASIVEADLAQLGAVLRLVERFGGAVETGPAQDEIAARLREELDYTREARNMRLYRTMLADVACVHVPEPVAELSTPRLLTMTWMEGESLTDAIAHKTQKERDAIAENMFRLWYVPFYRFGVIHGDAHPGNYTLREDGGINLLDYGCIRVFRPELVRAVIMLCLALRDNNEAQAVEAYRLWGFTKPSKKLVETLNLWARFIYAPFLEDRKQTLARTNATVQGRAIAAQTYQQLKAMGGVEIPPEFVFLDRASLGLGSLFLRLGAEVNWFKLFNELTEAFDVDKLQKRQQTLLG